MPIASLPAVTLPSWWQRWRIAVRQRWHPESAPDRRLGEAIAARDLSGVKAALREGADPSARCPSHLNDSASLLPPSWTQVALENRFFTAAEQCHAYEVALYPKHRRRLASQAGYSLHIERRSSWPKEPEEPQEMDALIRLVPHLHAHASDEVRAELYRQSAEDRTDVGGAIFQTLLEHAGGPEAAAGPQGRPHPLYHLFEHRNEHALRALLPHLPTDLFEHADRAPWNQKAETLLLMVVSKRLYGLVDEVLARAPASHVINRHNHHGHSLTALMMAVRDQRPDVALRLLDAGATAQQADRYGNTVLHHSARALWSGDAQAELAAHVSLWQRLLKSGASPQARNEKGETADDLLRQKGLPGIEECLAMKEARDLDAAMNSPAVAEPATMASSLRRRRF